MDTAKLSKEIDQIHEKHAKALIKRAGLDVKTFMEHPEKLKDQGYVFVHEEENGEHHFAVAKIVVEDRYKIDVKYTISDNSPSIIQKV